MRFIQIILGAIAGAVSCTVILWSVGSLFGEAEQNVSEVGQANEGRIRQIVAAMDTAGAETEFGAAHRKSLTGEISYDELRGMFSEFQSTSPDMREFAETWVDELPDSPYAQTALAWNLNASSRHMRGENLAPFTYIEAGIRVENLRQRAGRLAGLAFNTHPDLVPASDALLWILRANSPRRSDSSNGAQDVRIVLAKVMDLSPNRGSLVRALAATEPKWGGTFDGAIELCGDFSKFVNDVEGYTPDVCLVDAAYNYDYGAAVRTAARATLGTAEYDYLDYARRQDWEPGLSRATDKKILSYLQGEGSTDYHVATIYDRNVTRPNGLPPILPAVFQARRDDAHEKLLTDPNNPKLIDILTAPRIGVGPGENQSGGAAAIALSKQALPAAPYDSAVWENIALVHHSASDAADPRENAYFQNALLFSNFMPAHFFKYLTTKRADYDELQRAAKAGNLTETQTSTIDEAVVCPLIWLIRAKEFMCVAVADEDPYYHANSCKWDPTGDGYLDRLLEEAQSRNSCDAEINTDPIKLFIRDPTETNFKLPAVLAPS